MKRSKLKKHHVWYIGSFLICNLIGGIFIGNHAYQQIQNDVKQHGLRAQQEVQNVMDDYLHSFQLFTTMLSREITVEPNTDDISNYLKKLDKQLLDIEGDTMTVCICTIKMPIYTAGIHLMSNMKKAGMMLQLDRGIAMR